MVLRLTSREQCLEGVAWQKLLRDRYLDEGVPPVPHLDLKRAVVKPVSRKLALKYEWLGSMAQSTYHFGIFFGSYCAGVTCVCVGNGSAGCNAAKEFGVPHRQFATLVRGACVHWAPPGANSKLVSLTCRLLGKGTPAKLVIAYADTDAGEIGTIYQACNWAYVGKTQRDRQFIPPNGRILDERGFNQFRRNRGLIGRLPCKEHIRRLQETGWRLQWSNPKHKYVCVLDRDDEALAALVESKRQLYPKRAPVEGPS